MIRRGCLLCVPLVLMLHIRNGILAGCVKQTRERFVQNWQVEFYESASGSNPVVDYLDSLSDREAARVRASLFLLTESGTALSMPHVRRMEGTPLRELRVFGRIQHRVFYVAVRGRRFLLLHAFTKKTQRTPLRELRTAIQRLADYEERFGP